MGPDQPTYRKGSPPCDAVADNDFGHYSMQQCLYKAIVEKNYGLRIKSMRLAQFHPDALTSYRMVTVPDHSAVVQEVMRLRAERFAKVGT